MHVAEQGEGMPVVLCHGFPELGYSWRHQLPALAEAGFRAIVPDMRGYGKTSAPEKVEDYAMEHLVGDMTALLDALELEKAVFVGHDWGGFLVWSMALHAPDRVAAVAGVNSPYRPRTAANPLIGMKANPRQFAYIVHFQEEGVAEKELSANVRGTFTGMMRQHDPKNALLSDEELNTFVKEYERTGFRGGLNWYRNFERNWIWDESVAGQKVKQPALMVTAGKDRILVPALASHMEEHVENLTRGHIEDCGHWTQQERPEELNRILIDWLRTLPAE